ncbi:MAG: cyclic nucleotide-binding domain-containing protein [Spirochaetes bacterium]|nr:MAG: cyclic nucleotide-binding domain-containing protein [Spirochaetota bacterium]
MGDIKSRLSALQGEIYGGFAAMLVSLPSSIAFGIIIYSPMGAEFASRGAMAGVVGAIMLGLIAPLTGGTPGLVSAPCAPAAAVLSAFVLGVTANGTGTDIAATLPSMILLVIMACGLLQVFLGLVGGGRFIKYIPYSVVSGYLSGVGLLIILGQLPRLFSVPGGGMTLWKGLATPDAWNLQGLSVGLVTIVVMVVSQQLIRKVPAAILALVAGIASYWAFALYYPAMATLMGNSLVVGPVATGTDAFFQTIVNSYGSLASVSPSLIPTIAVTAITLAVLLSIDTLKTCLVLDAMTRSRHDSNRELFGQGIANIGSSLACGIAGAGTMGPTLVNAGSGGRRRLSGVLAGLFSVLVLLFLTSSISWVPLPALAGILVVIGARMIDFKNLYLLKHRSTRFDFLVYLAVVVTALYLNLIAAAGMGIVLSILIFLRDQMRQPVVRRKVFGNQFYSRKHRIPLQREILNARGEDILIVELQGPLFFGTSDQLMTEIEPHLEKSRYLILDMRRVAAVDYTAVHRIDQIEQTVSANGGELIFTSVPINLPTGQNVQAYLSRLGLSQAGRNIRYLGSLDEGIQWAEDRILESVNSCLGDADLPLDLAAFTFFLETDRRVIEGLNGIMEEKRYAPGEMIFGHGDEGREIFFIRKGSVRIDLPLSGGMSEHLATFGKGDFFGDMAFLVKGGRSANAVAEDEAWLYVMTRASFDALCEIDHRFGETVYLKLASALAKRLRQTDVIIKTLVEN